MKARIAEIVDKAEQQFAGIALHVGFVGYRDYSDAGHFVVHNFTHDLDHYKASLGTITASSGGGDGSACDVPEDVLGGMDKALTAVSWGDRGSVSVCLQCD